MKAAVLIQQLIAAGKMAHNPLITKMDCKNSDSLDMSSFIRLYDTQTECRAGNDQKQPK